MIVCIKALSAIVLAGFASLLCAQETADVIGDAYRLGSDELIYREYHFYLAESEHKVVYRSPGGDEVALKQLRYGEQGTQPDVDQRNLWCGEKIDVDVNHASGQVAINYRDCGEKDSENKQLQPPQPLVIDAGFDRYVREHWAELNNGEKHVFHYLAPSQLRTIRFAAERADCDAGTELETGELSCFTIKPDVWWLRWVLDPINLIYDNNKRRLLRFRGLGNIADASGDYLEVEIRYRYR